MSNTVFNWSKVYINGKDYGVHEVSISAAISNDLPGRLNFGSGITQRTGTIRWNENVGRRGISLSPYRRVGREGFRLPTPNDTVRVVMGSQEADPRLHGFVEGVTVFTGKVDKNEAPHAGPIVTHIVDNIDRLNRVTRLYAYRHRMPPLAGQTNRFRNTNLTPDTVLTWLAERCGFYTHPRHPGGATPWVAAHMQGSTLPTPGFGQVLYSSLRETLTDEIPEFVRTSTGLAFKRGWCEYAPTNKGTAKQKTVFSLRVGAEHVSDARVRLTFSSAPDVLVIVDGTRRVFVEIDGGRYTGPVVPADGYFSLSLDRSGGLQIATASEQSNHATPSRGDQALAGIIVNCLSGKAAISGLLVYGINSSDATVREPFFTQTAFIDAGRNYSLPIVRSVRDREVIEVIREICKATLCVCYLDGQGRLVIRHGRSAYGNPARTMGTLGVREHIKGYQIEDDSQLAASSVVVKYDTEITSELSRAAGSYTTLWEAPSTQVNRGETASFMIGPGADEEWLEVDLTMRPARFNLPDFMAHNGSFAGFTQRTGRPGNAVESWGTGDYTFERITPWEYLVTLTPDQDVSTGVPEVSEVKESMWGSPLPIVRGGALMKVTPAEPVIVTGGPSNAADLVHEAGPWMNINRANNWAEFISDYAFNPLPLITDIECFFDPRIEVNTKWTLDLTETAGVSVTAYILGVEHDPAADTTRVNVRVLTKTDPWVWASLVENYDTFAQVQGAYSDLAAVTRNERK